MIYKVYIYDIYNLRNIYNLYSLKQTMVVYPSLCLISNQVHITHKKRNPHNTVNAEGNAFSSSANSRLIKCEEAFSLSFRTSHNPHIKYSAKFYAVPQCFIALLLGLLLSQGWHGIFNMCHDLRACCAHKGETCTDKPAQGSTRKNWKRHLSLPTGGHTHTPCCHWLTLQFTRG